MKLKDKYKILTFYFLILKELHFSPKHLPFFPIRYTLLCIKSIHTI